MWQGQYEMLELLKLLRYEMKRLLRRTLKRLAVRAQAGARCRRERLRKRLCERIPHLREADPWIPPRHG